MDCIACACQTTSNDRFRLAEAQLNKRCAKYILTAIGCKNFSKALQADSLTEKKLEEVAEEGAKFVILEQAMNERLRKSGIVITYAEFFDELNRKKLIWP